MDSDLNIHLRITHSRNLPAATALAALAAAALTEALADDPQVLVTATLQSAALTGDGRAPTIRLAKRYIGVR